MEEEEEGKEKGREGGKEMLTFSNNIHRVVYSLKCHLVRNMF